MLSPLDVTNPSCFNANSMAQFRKESGGGQAVQVVSPTVSFVIFRVLRLENPALLVMMLFKFSSWESLRINPGEKTNNLVSDLDNSFLKYFSYAVVQCRFADLQ